MYRQLAKKLNKEEISIYQPDIQGHTSKLIALAEIYT